MKIILLGYMASGKSYVLKTLAESFDVNAIDLDTYIETQEGMCISDIFKNKGEIYFRTHENKYLKQLLDSKKSFVLALGGGTPCYANNMDLITKAAISIYLKASINTLYNRLCNEKGSRPLIAKLNNDTLKEFIAKHLFERAPFYEQASQTILVEDVPVAEMVNQIKGLL